ncbi:phage tail protein [Brucella anthropi]|uniref:phage tail protein n=1 Tax=Brucella anthropi TaxID=529 RepID=UPI003CC80492
MSESLDRAPELVPAIESLHAFKYNPPDQIVPYLIAEYGLTEIEDYIKDPRQVISEGLIWQRLIGTPAAVHRALRWIQFDGDIEEAPFDDAKWWQFQIHLAFEVQNTNFVRPMASLVQASKPLRSQFVRVTSGWDVRAFRLDTDQLDGEAYLDDWSGIRRADDEPILSLRVHTREHVRLWPDVVPVRTTNWITRSSHSVLGLKLPHHGSFASISVAPAKFTEPAIQPFRNASFSSARFGVPSSRAHSGL